MKKIWCLLLLLICFILSGLLFKFNDFQETEIKVDKKLEPTGSNDLAIMLENDNGEYELSTSDTWPTDGYEFNATLSNCENGGKLSWNSKTKSIELRTRGSDKCYVYFDQKKEVNFVEYIKSLSTDKKVIQGEGYLYYHDVEGTLANGAQDKSYRYSGNNPNNYVCFGSTDATCPETNMYRIIGVFNIDGSEKVKLIKSEYITADKLGIASNGTLSMDSSYTGIARVQIKTGLVGFYWNSVGTSDWSSASLQKALNDTGSTYYLGKLGATWSNKIAPSTWYISGHNTVSVTAKQMRDAEMNSKVTLPAVKVGLMYASDYGYAASEESWIKNLYDYNNDTSKQTNWLFNGVDEWLISPYSGAPSSAFYVNLAGYVNGNGDVSYDAYGVRPSFYLNSSVNITSTGTGSHENPYRIN